MGLFDSFKAVFQKKDGPKKVNVRQRFEILREAISGTMSKFYQARDRQSGQIVGLKLLNPEKTAQFEARFKGLNKPSEGEISYRLQHRNIVRTFEYGTTTDGEPYLVQEFIDGPGLNSLLIGSNREILEGIRMMLIRQIGDALQAVHDAGFIHRDICPRNVMVDTNEGILKLIDFGLTIPNEEPFRQPGNRTGNPNYMAPELVRRKRTDQRVDLFAFGITVYEMLTFELPWTRGLTGKAAMDHASSPPTPIERYRPMINPELAKAVHWCLEQNPEKRCPSVSEFLKRIASISSEDDK